jgi:serine/threonine protein kinase/WD40 repeat protein
MSQTEIFNAAVKLSPDVRAAFLERACGADHELRQEVESLLQAHDAPDSFLREPGGRTATYEPLTEGPGTVIGPYKLLQHIGEGGFGAVYMAEQEHPVRRKVALKIIKPGMDTREVIARFESERQALAMMDHPNIARVFDAGATESGRPYFVMELVRGIPITEFCDRNKLSAEQRLKLFVTVCHAIQHAHHKGVIHRDIKPSNVMITLHDGVPVVKVIDFGVAKATAQKLTERTLFTAYGQMIGTPAYMSPEQAEMSGLDIDTRSDIFSLGVLLYELLTGTTPLDSKQLRQAGYAEVQRLIREEEAPRPSTRFSSLGGEATVLANNRSTDVKRLAQLLRSDLDWIVMKSLEKDRNRRYGSPAQFAADVERFLTEQPVEARPPSTWYRFCKAARRNKAALVTAGAVAAALVAGTGVSVWQAVAAGRAKSAALAALDEKEKARLAEAEQRAAAVQAADETKATNERLRLAHDQQRADQYAWDMRGLPLIWESGNALEAKRLLERQPANLRGFEWHYWDRATHSELLSTKLSFEVPRRRPTAEWTFSGDGTRLALVQWPQGGGFAESQGESKEQEVIVTVWDVATRKVVRTHRFPRAVEGSRMIGSDNNRTQLSHDGKRILMSQQLFTDNGRGGFTATGARVEVFDVARGKMLLSRRFEKEAPLMFVASVILRPDGRKLIAGLQTREANAGASAGPATKPVGSEIQVFDLDAGDKEPLTIPDAGLRALSADGSRFVSVRPRPTDDTFSAGPPSEPRECKIWDTETGKELAHFEVSGSSQLFTDGKELFSVVLADGQKSDRLLLKSWSAETGQERLSVPLPFPALRQARRITPTGEVAETVYLPLAFLVFDRDGKNLLVGNSTSGPRARNPEIVSLIDRQTGRIRATVDNPNDRAGTADRGPPGPFRDPDLWRPFFTADGKQFVLADDNVIRTFDSVTGRLLLTLRGHEDAVAARAEAPDGRLWSVEADGTLKQWSLQPPEPVRIGTAAATASGFPLFVLSANGAWVARVYVAKGELPDEYRSIVEVWDNGGKGVKIFRKSGGPRGNRTQFFPNATDPTAVAISASGRNVALLRPAALPPRPADGKNDAAIPRQAIAPADLTVWDVDSGEEIYHTEIPDPPGTDPTYSRPTFTRDGATVTVLQHVRFHQSLRMFDIPNRREKPAIEFKEAGSTVSAVAASAQFSPDGRRLAVVVLRGGPITVSLYDVASGKRQDIDARVSRDSKLTWSPDGKRLLVTYQSGNESEINIYDTATGKLSASLYTADQLGRREQWDPSISSTGPVFSPDGRRVASLTNTRQSAVIKVWDAESGKDLLTIPVAAISGTSLRGSLYHLAFTPENHRLVAVMTTQAPRGRGIAAAIRVTTYDATPRPEPKQP